MDEKELEEYLLSLESPFSWNIPIEYVLPGRIESQIEKFQTIEEENELQWTRLIVSLGLSYDICINMNDFAKAQDHITWCRQHLTSLQQANCKELLFRGALPVLLHVITVTEALILLASGQLNKAREKVNDLRSLTTQTMYSSTNRRHRPYLQGIKAALYLQYGTPGHRMALEAAKKARDEDPEQAEWWFIVGNALGRIRRVENGTISSEETDAIEKAFLLQKDASYTVHLAQHYSELSSDLFFNQKLDKSRIYAIKAMERYREAIRLRPNCTSLKLRVAHGLLRIRHKDAQDIPLAKKLLDEAKTSVPNNSMLYHDLGLYFDKFKGDYKEALINLHKSNELGNPKALFHSLTIKWKYGLQSETIRDLEEALKRYSEEEQKVQLLVCLGASYALISHDWNSAITCFQKSLEIDPSAKYLEKFNILHYKTVNLLDLIINHLHFNVTNAKRNSVESFLGLVHQLKPQYSQFREEMKTSFQDWEKELSKMNKRHNLGKGNIKMPQSGITKTKPLHKKN